MALPWVYNDGEAGGLLKLRPENSGMPELAASGNVLTSLTGAPAAHWTGGLRGGRVRRGTGTEFEEFPGFPVVRCLARRYVDWLWRIAATSEAALAEVENKIARYLLDGRTFILSDGVRSSAYAVLAAEGTGRGLLLGKTPDGRWLCDWRLRFLVTVPAVSATGF